MPLTSRNLRRIIPLILVRDNNSKERVIHMKASEALIAWSPAYSRKATRGQVKVGPLLDENVADWTEPYSFTGGAAFQARRDMKGWQSIARVLIDFHTLVIRDGILPEVAHEAFLAIDEYAKHCSPDNRGA
jgi:hypothetical protein